MTLPDLERECWAQLAAALKADHDGAAGDGFKTLTVATCTADGADARTVVLRQVDTDRQYVWFYTDARAAKVLEMEAFPNVTLLFWDPARQVQLRLKAETRLHTDDYVADQQWTSLWVGGRKTYLSERTPGTELPAPYPGFPEHLGEKLPTPEESEAGRPNFAVIECRILAMDYLHLSRAGQTRARFTYEPVPRQTWLAP